MKKIALVFSALVCAVSLNAQKPSLDHSVYDGWKSLTGVAVPYNGEWLIYHIKPQEGDAVLKYYNIRSGETYTFDRGNHSAITPDGSKAIFKISPAFAQTRQAKIDKKKKEDMPQDTMAVIDLKTGDITKYPNVGFCQYGNELTRFVAYKHTKAPAADTTAAQDEKAAADTTKSDKKPAPKKDDSWKTTLMVLDILSGKVDTVKNVDKYSFSYNGDKIAFTKNPAEKDSVNLRGLYIYNPADSSTVDVFTTDNKKAYLDKFGFTRDGLYLTFFANTDTAKSASKDFCAYIYDGTDTRKLIDSKDSRIPEGMILSKNRALSFNQDYTKAFFGIAPIPHEKDTTVPEFERAKLDIWTWNEDILHTQQKFAAGTYRDGSFLCHIDFDGGGDLVQIEDEIVRNATPRRTNNQDYVLAISDKPYLLQKQWDMNAKVDLYRVSMVDGSRELLLEGAPIKLFGSSPDGKYYVWYDYVKQAFYQYDVNMKTTTDLTSELDAVFYDDTDDHPCYANPTSSPVWQADSKVFYLRDKYDLWQFDVTRAKAPICLTKGEGAKTRTTYTFANFYSRLGMDPDYSFFQQPGKMIYLDTFNEVTKKHGYACINPADKKPLLRTLQEGPYTYSMPAVSISGKKNTFVSVRGNYETGNNLWLYTDNFATEKQLSDINPQQRDYNWGTVELVKWTARTGRETEGLLFKPENFDESKRYPVLVYFYERSSQELYSVKTPAPSRSVINIPYFVSNEYVVFVPDIWYEVGHPGRSALDYVMSGCDMLCEYPWIDGDNMAIQGQSWGGYQVAYMITQTGRFKAAGAGAPVSNMTSAYGGIRWGSGMVRQFQYEQQQSRIGSDLWNGFDLYVENSPIFFVPNVTTPVLIMHNDADGAVPWWQGIEFFTALRRCGKQAWMLQYNGEEHNLAQRRNAKDLSVRLADFFDHFLKGKPMPQWMEKGVPYWEKE